MKLRQSKRRQLRMSIDEEKKTITMEEKGICEIVSNLLAKYDKYDNITKQFYEIPLTKDFLNEEYIEYIFSTQRRSSEDVVYLSKYLSTYKAKLQLTELKHSSSSSIISLSIQTPYHSGNLVPIKAKMSFQDSQCDSLDLKIKSIVMDNMCNKILHRNQKRYINMNTIDLIAMDKEVEKFQLIIGNYIL